MPLIKIVQDLSGGTPAMRAARTTYLPMEPRERPADYDARLDATVLFEGYSKTRDSLVGLVYNGEITLKEDVPKLLKDYAEDVDLAGNHIDVFGKARFLDQFEGASVILVDMERPDNQQRKTLAGNTRADSEAFRPYMVGYRHDQVTNWRKVRINGKEEYTLITFRECAAEADGEYGEAEVVRYRTFKRPVIDEGRDAAGKRIGPVIYGAPMWELWRENKQHTGEDDRLVWEDGGDLPISRISVAVGGELGSKPPLLGLGYLNISHWRNSSDQENILHITRVPKLVQVGGDPPGTGTNADDEIVLNVTSTLWVPENGDVKWLEIKSEGSISVGRQHLLDIQDRMAMMGLATLTQRSDANITAYEKAQDAKEKHSTLSTMARSHKDQMELALEFMAEYKGLESGGSIELPASQEDLVFDAQDLQLAYTMHKEGRLTPDTFYMLASKRWRVDLSEEGKAVEKILAEKAKEKPAELPPAEKEPPEMPMNGGVQ
jgi:hypothetical protein